MSIDKLLQTVSIPDFDAGMEFLTQLPLANPIFAEKRLSQFLDVLQAQPLDTESTFRLLEQARVPQFFVAEELARGFCNKALPLAPEEGSAFELVLSAWRKMEKAYAGVTRIKHPVANPSPEYLRLIATILQRCIFYVGAQIFEHYRARQELPKGIWRNLHNYFILAEAWGVAGEPVADALDPSGQTSHCTGAYVAALLTELASPYSLTLRDLNLIHRWAVMWAPLVGISQLDPAHPPAAYVVDLNKDSALQPLGRAAQNGILRVLDNSRLAIKLAQVQDQLRHRISPSQVGLGEETFGHAGQLLEQLIRPWTRGESPRRFRRFATAGQANVVCGFEAMYFHINGLGFEQPPVAPTYTRRDYDRLFTFRERVDAEVPEMVRARHQFPSETWSVQNHSANGFRICRTETGMRLQHGQLIAIKPHDGDHYILAVITRLIQINSEGGLEAGVSTLPGIPTGIGVRTHIPGTPSSENFAPAFALPGLSSMHEDPSIVLPPGMYHASRPIEIHSGGGSLWQARMRHILQRGMGFDRVSYQTVLMQSGGEDAGVG